MKWRERLKDRKFNRTSQNKTSSTRPRQSDFHRQNLDSHLASPVPMARIDRVNAKNRHTLNPAHKPTHGEQKIARYQAIR